LLTLLREAGWPVWPLLLTSVVGLALIVERLLALRRSRILPEGVERDASELVARGQDSPEALSRLARHSPLGSVLAEVARLRHASPEQLRASVEDQGRTLAFHLSRRVDALGTVAVVAPLLGLFGTVVGMIEIFGSYSPVSGDPRALAGGISIALYNTGFGILIAIPATLFHRYFRSRVDALLFELEAAAARLARQIGATP